MPILLPDKAKMKKLILVVILIFFAIVPLIDLMHPGLFIAHDSESHVARLASFYQSLSEGNLVPRWAANLNSGYGTPILMFLYPLPEYLGSLIHFIGFSLIDSVKIVFLIGYIFSGIFMYLWAKEEWGEVAGLVAGVFYLLAPYRFVDLYVRAAIGENTAFVFIPLVLWAIYKIERTLEWKYMLLGSFALTGLVLSHNAILLMFLPIIFFYVIYRLSYSKCKKEFFSAAIFTLLIGFLLSAFFLLPAFFEGKYTLRDIVTSGDQIAKQFPALSQLLYSKWGFGVSAVSRSGFSMQIGIVQWVVVGLGVIGLFTLWVKKERKTFVFLLFCQVIFWLTLYLMTVKSLPIWQTITLLQKFQFPWRLLSISVFVTAVMTGIIVKVAKNNLFTFVLIAAVVFMTKDFWHAQGYFSYNDKYFINDYLGTTDTGESSPRWSIRWEEELAKAPLEAVSGTVKITQIKRLSNLHSYEVESTTSGKLVENTLYFPGWEVYINGKKTDIEFQDQNHRGKMTFLIPKGRNQITVKFNETKLRKISDYLSLITIMCIVTVTVLKLCYAKIIRSAGNFQRRKKPR